MPGFDFEAELGSITINGKVVTVYGPDECYKDGMNRTNGEQFKLNTREFCPALADMYMKLL